MKAASVELKGRELKAFQGFKERLKGSLGKTLVSVEPVARRTLDLPPAAPLLPTPAGKSGGALPLPPVAPAEVHVLVRVERRDVFAEDRIDAAALDVALEMGSLVVATVQEGGA